jgi:hypothetical protein
MFSIFNHKQISREEWKKFEKKNAEKIAAQNAAEELTPDDPEMSPQQLKVLLKNPPDEDSHISSKPSRT